MAVRPHKTIPNAWVIDYWPDGRKGKRVRETFVGNFEDANKRHTELCLDRPLVSKNNTNPKLEEVLPEYLKWLHLHRSAAYYKSMVWALDKLKPVFGRHPVSRFTPVLFDQFKELHRSTPAHCNQCIKYLLAIIGWMVKRNYARPLNFTIDRLPHFRNIPQPPNPGEFDLFMEQVRHGLQEEGISKEERKSKELLLLLIYETGLRWIEARHLKWENLHADGRIYLGRTKTGEARFTVISKDLLQKLLPNKRNTGYIFVNPKTNKPYGTLRKLIVGARERSGVTIKGTHGLRHALGTDMLEATGDLRAVQDVLGHSTIKTSEKYTHISIGRKQRVLEQTQAWRKDQSKPTKKVDSTKPAE